MRPAAQPSYLLILFLFWLTGLAITTPTPTRGQDSTPFILDFGLGAGLGVGGWTDRSFTAPGQSRSIEHSSLGGFITHLTLGYALTPRIAPILRLTFGGGAFAYDQPAFGLTGTFDTTQPTKTVTYGRFTLAVGSRFEIQPAATISLFGQLGLLIVLPLTERFDFTSADGASTQRYEIDSDVGVGVFVDFGAALWLTPSFGVRLALSFEGADMAWSRLVRHAGTGAYFSTTDATYTAGEIRYEDGDFADQTPPASPNFSIRRHKGSDGLNGFVGAVSLTIGFVVRW